MFKVLDPTKDIKSTTRTVYEYAPISGSVSESGTYPWNTKSYVRRYPNQIFSGSLSGSFFTTYHDRAISSADAVELFDMSFGLSVSSSYYTLGSTLPVKVRDGKNRMYKFFANKCWGSSNERFSKDGTYYDELFFMFFKRNTFHDQLRRGYCTMYTYFADAELTGSVAQYSITDVTGRSSYYEAKGGRWQYLMGSNGVAGWAFYDLGLLVLIPTGTWGMRDNYYAFSGTAADPGKGTYYHSVTGSIIDDIVACALNKIDSNNYTHPIQVYAEEVIKSQLVVCNIGLDDFNYSSNPTYVDPEGRIIMTSGSKSTKACSYITTIGLYDSKNELLAVAKTSEPIKKSSDAAQSVTLRLNY